MTQTTSMNKKPQDKNLKQLQNARLLDGVFFTKCFNNDNESIQLILRIILNKPDLKVTQARAGAYPADPLNHSDYMDIHASDESGRLYRIEILLPNAGTGAKRARFYSSTVDFNPPKEKWNCEKLPETYVILITENDMWHEGRPVYEVKRYFSETHKEFPDETHILYVNGSYRDQSPIGKLMHDFSCTNPADMNYRILASRVRSFRERKEDIENRKSTWREFLEKEREEAREEGRAKGLGEGRVKGLAEGRAKGMAEGRAKGMAEGRAEGLTKAARSMARNMIASGMVSLETVASVTGLSMDVLHSMKQEISS